MKINTPSSAFTLVELIVAISLSIFLMLSVGLFVQSGMQQIFNQQKYVDTASNVQESFYKWQSSIQSATHWAILDLDLDWDWNWDAAYIFKNEPKYDRGGYSVLWTLDIEDQYCDDPELELNERTTTHMILKQNITFNSTTAWDYTSYPNEHVIRDNTSWNIIIWKWIFGHEFTTWAQWTEVYINTPTWLVEDSGILYIADTLNHRILWYDISEDQTYTLVDINDGLIEPTELSINNWDLLITHKQGAETLRLSSEPGNSSTLSMIFSWDSSYNDIISYTIEFLPDTLNITDSNLNSNASQYIHYENNTLTNLFVNYGSTGVQTGCNSVGYLYNNGSPIHCTWLDADSGNWMWQNSSPSNISYTTETINLSNINITGENTSTTYYVKFSLLNSSDDEVFSDYFPYFINSDDDLLTKWDNILTVDSTGTSYDMSSYTFPSDVYNPETDILLSQPIENFEVTQIWDMLIFDIDYYSKYNCYNTDENITQKMVFTKYVRP